MRYGIYAVQRLMRWNGPRVLECDVLGLEMQVRHTKATVSHETLQCLTMGRFTATIAPRLPPRIPRQLLFNICALMCVIAACVDHLGLELLHSNVWMTLAWHCPPRNVWTTLTGNCST